jgi:hypothetical protein
MLPDTLPEPCIWACQMSLSGRLWQATLAHVKYANEAFSSVP